MSMAARLGNVLYWTANGAAALWVAGLFLAVLANGWVPSSDGERIAYLATIAIPALLALGFGRACRYVLSGR